MEQPIDEIYQKVSAGLIEQMKNKSGAMNILAELLLVSKNFERAAAHAQNVAEWVIYYIDGRHAHYLEEEGQLEIENDDG